MNFKKLRHLVFGFLKSVFYNFKLLPFSQAVHLPIVVSEKTRLNIKRGGIKFGSCKINFGLITIGIWDGDDCIGERMSSSIIVEKGSFIQFDGRVSFASGLHMSICNQGYIVFGNCDHFNANVHIICRNHIIINSDCNISWNCTIMDTDLHNFQDDSTGGLKDNSILIGKHCLICSDTKILKGVVLGDYSIVGANTLLPRGTYPSGYCYINALSIKKLPSNTKNMK